VEAGSLLRRLDRFPLAPAPSAGRGGQGAPDPSAAADARGAPPAARLRPGLTRYCLVQILAGFSGAGTGVLVFSTPMRLFGCADAQVAAMHRLRRGHRARGGHCARRVARSSHRAHEARHRGAARIVVAVLASAARRLASRTGRALARRAPRRAGIRRSVVDWEMEARALRRVVAGPWRAAGIRARRAAGATVVTRIRISGIRPGALDEFKVVARDWKRLLEKHGGRVLGFYFDETENSVTGIAEYESRARLSEIQRRCEADAAYAAIPSRAERLTTSFGERILDKFEVDP
jgi:hypothetical protein